jgi:galactonate dehydratase
VAKLYFLKLTVDEGVVGWSEFDEGFGSPGVSAVIERLAGRVVGQPVFDHERIYTELYCFTRPAAGGVVAEGLGAIENALLDAKAKALGVRATGSSEAGCEIVFGSIGRIARLGG